MTPNPTSIRLARAARERTADALITAAGELPVFIARIMADTPIPEGYAPGQPHTLEAQAVAADLERTIRRAIAGMRAELAAAEDYPHRSNPDYPEA